MLLLVDNYDSFTYNLFQYFAELGAEVVVKRNDEITVDAVEKLSPSNIVISPGPCTPNEAGISLAVIARYGPHIPLLGVCLGHQAIGQVFGGHVIRAPKPVHGKTDKIYHNGEGLFAGLDSPITATRYHSLIVERETLPPDVSITAWNDEGLIMGLQHKEYPIFGVQFHPESILTTSGMHLLQQFLEVTHVARLTQ